MAQTFATQLLLTSDTVVPNVATEFIPLGVKRVIVIPADPAVTLAICADPPSTLAENRVWLDVDYVDGNAVIDAPILAVRLTSLLASVRVSVRGDG